jgi:flagellar protein FlbD
VIRVTRINNTPIILNSDLIEQIEMVPDTMIALTNGQRLFVQETVEEVVERIVEFRRKTLAGLISCPCGPVPVAAGGRDARVE